MYPVFVSTESDCPQQFGIHRRVGHVVLSCCQTGSLTERHRTGRGAGARSCDRWPMGRSHQKGPVGAALQPRSRRESVFLVCTLLIAGFFLWRVCQFKNTQQPQTVWVSTTFPRSHAHNTVEEEDDTPRVVTELVIDNGRDGRGFRQPHNKQLPASARKGTDPDRSGVSGTDSKAGASDKAVKLLESTTSEGSDKGSGTKPGLKRPQDSGTLGDASTTSRKGDNSTFGSQSKQGVSDQESFTLPGLEEGDQRSAGLGTAEQQETNLFETSILEKPTTQLVVGEGSSTSSQRADPQKTPRVPADFDWQTYLLYHPELKDEGVVSEETAKQHYLSRGRAQGYVYRRLRVVLRYTACTGLINQQYSHIAAFALAAVLGAELVLPPAVKRDSFAKYFSMDKTQNEVSWTPDDLDTLLDTEKIIRFWKDRGLTVHRVRHPLIGIRSQMAWVSL